MYHYGMTIKMYREKRNLTQLQLAELWTKDDGTTGVSSDYVGLVERGIRKITNIKTLRGLCEALDIPLWELGLSEYDPFTKHLSSRDGYLFPQLLEAIEGLIRTCWHIRRTQPLPVLLSSIRQLSTLMDHLLQSLSQGMKTDKRVLSLYAQVLRLEAIVAGNLQEYDKALAIDYRMLNVANEANDPVAISLAYLAIGTELERRKQGDEAVAYLEQARDESFRCGKQMAALTNAYLGRGYAAIGDDKRFLRTMDVSEAIARDLNGIYGNGEEYVFHKLSGIMAERSYGLIELNLPQQSLRVCLDIETEMEIENNWWLRAWLPLDYARAYLAIGELQASIHECMKFYTKIKNIGTPHGLKRVHDYLRDLDTKGYGNLLEVQEFEKMVTYNEK